MKDPASLQLLHDIVTPAPVSWLPPAPGWYALGLALGLLSAWILLKNYVKWKKNRYRRQALFELARFEKGLSDNNSRGQTLSQLPQLVKRTAIAAYGREPVAALAGAEWLLFLDKTGSTNLFTKGSGRLLGDCSCQSLTWLAGISQKQTMALHKAVRHWISNHSEPKELSYRK